MKYDTILFDLDGTLLDTLEDLRDAVNYIQRKNGYPEHELAYIRSVVGNGIRNLLATSTPDGESNPNFETMFAEFQEYYLEHNQDKTAPYPGIMDLLEELNSRGIKMAIVTNKNQPTVDLLCQDVFKGQIKIAVGDNMTRPRKPDAAPVYEAMSLLGIEAKSADNVRKDCGNVVYIGDSQVDAKTAENSGLDYILVTWGFRDRDLLETFNPVAIIDSPEEILNYL